MEWALDVGTHTFSGRIIDHVLPLPKQGVWGSKDAPTQVGTPMCQAFNVSCKHTQAHSMEDSDDDHFPEFTLDDQTLAFLVQEESKFIWNTQTADTGPPPKHQKTTSSQPIQQNGSINTMEELPDISVQMNGMYMLQVRPRQPPEQTSQPQMVRTTSSPSYSQLQQRPDLPSSQPRGEPPLHACSVTTPARGILLPSCPPTSTCVVRTPTPFSSQNMA